MEFDKRGIPILPLDEKIEALRMCLNDDCPEDAMSHLFDLLSFCQEKMRRTISPGEIGASPSVKSELLSALEDWNDASLVSLRHLYGDSPTPVKEADENNE